MLNKNDIPETIYKELVAYVDHGKLNSMFLYNLLAGDRAEAMKVKQVIERDSLFMIVAYIKLHVPKASQGTPNKVWAWTEAGGLAGIYGMSEKQFTKMYGGYKNDEKK